MYFCKRRCSLRSQQMRLFQIFKQCGTCTFLSRFSSSNHFSYRTFSMAHSDVAFNVKRRCSSESECFHMSINQCVVHVVCHAPCALESRNQFVVDRATMMINQLDLFVGSIMGIAVVDQNVESIWTNKKQKIKNVVLSAIQVQISATNTYFSEGEWFFNYIRKTAQKVSRRYIWTIFYV